MANLPKTKVVGSSVVAIRLHYQPRVLSYGGFVLGSDHFQRQIATLLGRRTWKGSPGRSEKPVADPAQQALPL
jgi:putative transposase